MPFQKSELKRSHWGGMSEKDHINIYSKSKTRLGRELSNFERSPFVLEDDGWFASVEAYWFWIGTREEGLRKLSGFAAKKRGSELERKFQIDEELFKLKIKTAIREKLLQNRGILERFLASELPFDHYYLYGDKVVRQSQHAWLVDAVEGLRSELKASLPPMVRHFEGDITEQLGKSVEVVAHGCNCKGSYAKGVALALANRWPKSKEAYMRAHRKGFLRPGFGQFVPVKEGLVANLMTQDGYGRGGPHFDYQAAENVLSRLKTHCKAKGLRIGIPRIGAGLAGGDWNKIEQMLERVFFDHPVYVFTRPQDSHLWKNRV